MGGPLDNNYTNRFKSIFFYFFSQGNIAYRLEGDKRAQQQKDTRKYIIYTIHTTNNTRKLT